jgi:hypothetical protein
MFSVSSQSDLRLQTLQRTKELEETPEELLELAWDLKSVD